MRHKHTSYSCDINNSVNSLLSEFVFFSISLKYTRKKSHLMFNGIIIGKLKPLQALNIFPFFPPIVPHSLLFCSRDDFGICYKHNIVQIFVKLVWITQQCLVQLYQRERTEPSGNNEYGVWQRAGVWIKWTLCWCGLAPISAHLTRIAGWTWLP